MCFRRGTQKISGRSAFLLWTTALSFVSFWVASSRGLALKFTWPVMVRKDCKF